jgi:hypothetical protein
MLPATDLDLVGHIAGVAPRLRATYEAPASLAFSPGAEPLFRVSTARVPALTCYFALMDLVESQRVPRLGSL